MAFSCEYVDLALSKLRSLLPIAADAPSGVRHAGYGGSRTYAGCVGTLSIDGRDAQYQIYLTEDLTQEADQMAQLYRGFLKNAAITLVVGVLLLAWVLFRALKPLGILQTTAAHIADGAYGERAPVKRKDEVGLLAADFNRMAQAVQTQLRTQHQVDAYIYEIPRPEITLRLTGQRAQLTALSDAYDALDQAAEQLFALSQAIDQGKEQDYRAALTSTRETATALRGRLAALFDAPPQAVQQVMDLLQALADGLEQAANAQSAVRLGAQIKYCQLLCISRMAAFAAGLAP